jgi:hypothetical protein
MPIFVQARDPPGFYARNAFLALILYCLFIQQKTIPSDCNLRGTASCSRKVIFLMTRSLSQEPDEIKYAGLAIECGHLNAFLEGLRCNATVLLMIVERTIANGGTLHKQLAVHVTARGLEHDRPVYYCTFLAAEVSGAGKHGYLTYPAKEERAHPQVMRFASQLAAELQDCLVAVLTADARVLLVRPCMRYRLPDPFVWGLRSSLDGTGIRFQDWRWQASSPAK